MEYILTFIIAVYSIIAIAISLNFEKNVNKKMIKRNGMYYMTYIKRYPYHVRVVIKELNKNFMFFNTYKDEKEYQFSENYKKTDQYYRIMAIDAHFEKWQLN
jgi:hypothetical protein